MDWPGQLSQGDAEAKGGLWSLRMRRDCGIQSLAG